MSEDKYYSINHYQRLNPTNMGIFFFDDNCDGNILIEWSEAPKLVVALIEIIKSEGKKVESNDDN